MAKYIDADKTLEILRKSKEKGLTPNLVSFVSLLTAMPEAVVRCEDCKYIWVHENGCYECGYGFCEVRADFFCADGVRRESK